MTTMDLLFYVFLLSCVLWYLRYKNNQYQARKFVFNMKVLHDELNELAFKGLVKEDGMFEYFSKSIEKVIQQHQLINIHSIFVYSYRHRKDRRKDKNMAILKEYCDNHPELKELYYRYCNNMLEYLKGQHKTFSLLLAPIFALIAVKKVCQRRVAAILKGLLVYPETSESSSMDLRSIQKKSRVAA